MKTANSKKIFTAKLTINQEAAFIKCDLLVYIFIVVFTRT